MVQEKMSMLVSLVCGLICAAVVSADYGYDGVEMCSRPWHLVFKHDHLGVVQSGAKVALKHAVLRGSVIRVVVSGVGGGSSGDHIVSGVNNINIRGAEVCGSVLDHVGQEPERTRDNTVWWFQLFCTTGFFQTVEYVIDGGTSKPPVTSTAGVAWYAFDPSPCSDCITPVYSHFSDGGSYTGLISNLANAVHNGKEIRVVRRDIGYTTNLDVVQTTPDNMAVNGQSVYHVGQVYTPTTVEYNTVTPYKWISSMSTTGRRFNQRYTFGGGEFSADDFDHVAMDWFVDPCWRHVYTLKQDDSEIGSVEDLVRAIEDGHRVRIKRGSKVMEAGAIYVTSDRLSVQAQLLDDILKKGGGLEDQFDFLPDARWAWSVVSTSKTNNVANDFFWYANSTQILPRAMSKETVSWYVDSRPWTKTLEVDSAGVVSSGTKASLQSAIKNGANIRVMVMETDPGAVHTYLPGDNAILYGIGGDNSNVQSMRILELDEPTGIQNPPLWRFYLAGTKGVADSVTYKYGEDNSFVKRDSLPVVTKFFVDDYIPY